MGAWALAVSEGIEASPVGAKALFAAAHLAFVQSDYERAEALSERSLALYREVGDPWGMVFSLFTLGNVAWVRGNTVAARSMTEEALALYRKIGLIPTCVLTDVSQMRKGCRGTEAFMPTGTRIGIKEYVA